MKMNMKFKEYVEILKDRCNDPAQLSCLTAPFGIKWYLCSEPNILIGHILDALNQKFELEDIIDSLDVATVAWELGCLNAGRFLDEAPMIIYREVSSCGTSRSLN